MLRSAPHLCGEPVGLGVGPPRLGQQRLPSEEEAPVAREHRAARPEDGCRHEEAEKPLVLLEEPPAPVVEEELRCEVHQEAHALVEHVRLGAVVDAVVEEPRDVRERVLVHRVDQSQVRHDEVEDRAALRHAAVRLAGGVDVLLRLLRLLHAGGNHPRSHLGVVQSVDEHFIVQDVPLALLQEL